MNLRRQSLYQWENSHDKALIDWPIEKFHIKSAEEKDMADNENSRPEKAAIHHDPNNHRILTPPR